jgi:putative transposase
VPKKQPKRSRLWLNDGSCIRLRPAYPNHVWSFDFVETRTNDGRRLRLMTLIDEFSRRCLAIHVARRINALDVIETLADVMLFEGIPAYIRSDNGPEMVAKVLRLKGLGSKSLYIEPGSPWENGYCESFNGKLLRDELLNGEISTALRKPRRSSRNGVSTITPDDHTQPSVTGRPHHSPSRRHHQPSTGHRSCNKPNRAGTGRGDLMLYAFEQQEVPHAR